MRAVIVLHHYLDLPLPEVAETLRIPLGTAKSRLYRALGLMRAALDADARPGRASDGRADRHDDPTSFGRSLSAWLDEEARNHAPAHLDAVLRRTRPRPPATGWSSLERWLPVQTTLRFSPVPRVAWILVVLALLIALGMAGA